MAYITLTASVDREARRLGINFSGPAVDTLLYEAARAEGYHDRDGLCKEVAKNFSLADKIALQALTDYLGYKVHLDAEDIRRLRLQANPIIRLALCCRPTPNDQIYAIPHTSRVITVHKQDCKSASTSQRKVKAEWNRPHDVVPIAELALEGWDRKGMLRDIAALLAAKDINIQSNSGQTYVGRTMAFRFTLELPNLSLLAELKEEIKKNVSGLTMVKLQSRIPPGRRGKIGARDTTLNPYNPLNPYNYQKPVYDPEMFFGRKIIMDTLRDIVRGQTKSSAVVLWGPPRIGKSSVLNMLSQELELEDNSTVIPILINWAGFTSVSLKEALTYIVRAISEKLLKKGKNLEDFRTETLATLRVWFLDLLSKALAMFPQKRFIFFMDEFGEVVCAQKAKALEQDFFGILSNVFFDRDKPVSFVFALPTTFTDKDLGEAFEGFVARMETPLHLSFLEENAARGLIIKPSAPAGLTYDDEAVEEIIHITNRHPYYIHLICGKLVEKHPPPAVITKKNVQEVTHLITSNKTSIGDYHGCFNHFWKEWPLGSEVLSCLAKYETAQKTGTTESTVLKEMIRKGFRGKPDDIRACLAELKRRGAVIEADSKEPCYRLIPMLREWVYHQKHELIPMSNRIWRE
jgi:predicted amino acid-binding ACT domain protein